MGLRDQKKSQTRTRIADVALRMFMERGFDTVTMADIARTAEVSASTLFNYFPTKESLVFDRAPDIEEAITAAISTRPPGTPILAAFKAFLLKTPSMRKPVPKEAAAFLRFVGSNPALLDYERRLFKQYERALAAVIEREARVNRHEAESVTGLVFDAYLRAKSSPTPASALNEMFEILQRGWAK